MLKAARPEGKRDRELIQACIDLQWFITTGDALYQQEGGGEAKTGFGAA